MKQNKLDITNEKFIQHVIDLFYEINLDNIRKLYDILNNYIIEFIDKEMRDYRMPKEMHDIVEMDSGLVVMLPHEVDKKIILNEAVAKMQQLIYTTFFALTEEYRKIVERNAIHDLIKNTIEREMQRSSDDNSYLLEKYNKIWNYCIVEHGKTILITRDDYSSYDKYINILRNYINKKDYVPIYTNEEKGEHLFIDIKNIPEECNCDAKLFEIKSYFYLLQRYAEYHNITLGEAVSITLEINGICYVIKTARDLPDYATIHFIFQELLRIFKTFKHYVFVIDVDEENMTINVDYELERRTDNDDYPWLNIDNNSNSVIENIINQTYKYVKNKLREALS